MTRPTVEVSARSMVYDKIRRLILAGQLQPGIPLSASKLAKAAGVSRTPVREALLRLVVEGLVQETRAGLFVTELSEEEIIQVYEIRVPLEAVAARLATANLTPLHHAQIEAMQAKFAAAASQDNHDPQVLAEMNLGFHRAIVHATRNRLLSEFMSRIYDAVGRFGSTTLRYPDRVREAVAEHEMLIAAIAARDADRAEEIAAQHMRHAMQVRLNMYREIAR